MYQEEKVEIKRTDGKRLKELADKFNRETAVRLSNDVYSSVMELATDAAVKGEYHIILKTDDERFKCLFDSSHYRQQLIELLQNKCNENSIKMETFKEDRYFTYKFSWDKEVV